MGETTFLSALADFIPDHERILLIEDTAEMQIQKDNVVLLDARGEPAITIRDLLKATLANKIPQMAFKSGDAQDQGSPASCKRSQLAVFASERLH
jgi:hypothetical protein